MKETELRLDPLSGGWTLFTRTRRMRPQLQSRKKDSFGAANPFAADNAEALPQMIYTSGSAGRDLVRVVPNRAPVLRVEGATAVSADGFYDHMDGVGAHEIIIETPGPEDFSQLPLPHVEEVITAWKVRMLDLSRDTRMRSFFIFKNVGAAAGAAFQHSISQLVAVAIVPPALKRKLITARAFYEQKKRAIFEDILQEEIRAGTRLVYENNGFAVFCPYASRVPFEQAIFPKRQCADFHGITDQETAQLADALTTALRKLDSALDTPAYHVVLTTAPARNGRRDYWNTLAQDFRWHIEILPRLFHSSAIEIGTGCSFNTVWPETAAAYLRNIEM